MLNILCCMIEFYMYCCLLISSFERKKLLLLFIFDFILIFTCRGRLWSYGSWIYNYLWNQCLSPLKLWVWILIRQGVLDTTLCDKVCQWLATGRWFSLGTPVSSTNKTDHHDITEILLKVMLNIINQTKTRLILE